MMQGFADAGVSGMTAFAEFSSFWGGRPTQEYG
jgi:hypothetical protein